MQMTKHDRLSLTPSAESSASAAHLSPSHIPFTLAQLSQVARLQITYRFMPVGQDGQKGYVGAFSERPLPR